MVGCVHRLNRAASSIHFACSAKTLATMAMALYTRIAYSNNSRYVSERIELRNLDAQQVMKITWILSGKNDIPVEP